MADDPLSLYRKFLAGERGTCIATGATDCHAFATEDEIEATYGSRHGRGRSVTHAFLKPGNLRTITHEILLERIQEHAEGGSR